MYSLRVWWLVHVRFAFVSAAFSFLPAVWSAENSTPVYSFSHFAGSPGGAGAADGVDVLARFYNPAAVAIDQAGNLYIADKFNAVIRKITPEGVVTTLAGTALQHGTVDGTGAAARFTDPTGVAVDAAGVVYVTDGSAGTIRRITPAGVVTTLAGSAEDRGGMDGPVASARFYNPSGIAIDTAGNLYIADAGIPTKLLLMGGQTIRKITPGGIVTTLAGSYWHYGYADGNGTSARFNRPLAVAVDSGGNVFVADSDNSVIRKITPTGEVTTLAGTALQSGSADGTGSSARFNHPHGLAVDQSGAVFVVDTFNFTLRKITPAGVVTTFAGNPTQAGSADGPLASARFNWPGGLTVDQHGVIFVADSSNNTVRKISDSVVTTIAGAANTAGSEDGRGTAARFNYPSGAALDRQGNVYVADSFNDEIRKITSTGLVTTVAGLAGQQGAADGAGATARFSVPSALAVDNAGTLYVADTSNNTIRKISSAGEVTTFAGAANQEFGSVDGVGPAARFYQPAGIAVDRTGVLYVADTGNNTIRKISPTGVVSTLAGSASQSGYADGVGSGARFAMPLGIAVDAAGTVFVADGANNAVRKITPAGVVTTLARGPSSTTPTGTPGVSAILAPDGIAVDDAGYVYVSDRTGAILRITPAGVVTTIGGNLNFRFGSSDGVGSAATFNYGGGIAVDAGGTLYLADRANNAIRKGIPIGGGQLVNISTRALIGTHDDVAIAGFVITGSESRQVLIRAGGPALIAFGLTGVLPDPTLKLFDRNGVELTRNTRWGADAAIKAAAQRVGAYAWVDTSLDSALLVTLAPGPYTAQVSGESGDTGLALIEVYDADTSNAGGLINLSTRSRVSRGADLQIAGFVISGTYSKQVLIRACGPALTSAFNMRGALPDPVLKLFDQVGVQIRENTIWSADPVEAATIRTVAARVGAFAWPAASEDSALFVTLPPGVYTAHVFGRSNSDGTALIEVYDADPPAGAP